MRPNNSISVQVKGCVGDHEAYGQHRQKSRDAAESELCRIGY